MNIVNTSSTLSAPEMICAYLEAGKKKAAAPLWKLFLLGVAAGVMIGFASVTNNMAGFSFANLSANYVVRGLLFPMGMVMVILSGAELFTGNCMIVTSVLSGMASLRGMFRNWIVVYAGNLAGSLLLAAAIVASGQLNLGGGALAAYTIKVAANKCALPFGSAFVLGILCNILVCLAVLCSFTARETSGRIMAAYIPVAVFITCGFEHSVANMYYIPVGILASGNSGFAQLAAELGADISVLRWGNFFARNLLPVTLGNIIGGVGIALLLWVCYKPPRVSVSISSADTNGGVS